MKYAIGFRSGARVELDVIDGAKFTQDICDVLEQAAARNYYREGGVLFCVDAVEYIAPATMVPIPSGALV